MPSLNRLTALRVMLLLAAAGTAVPCPYLAAQERGQEHETRTVEKEKPAEPTPAPPKEESSVTEHSIKIGGQTIPFKTNPPTTLLQNEKEQPPTLLYSTASLCSDA